MSNEIATIPQESAPMAIPAVHGIQAVARAEIDAQVATAKQYPRDVSLALRRAHSLATMNRDTAARMFYVVNDDGQVMQRTGSDIPRGAKSFGPSVRLTEIFLATWGNIMAGAKLVEIADEHLVVVGFAHDMETNTKTAVEHVESIVKSNRQRYGDRMVMQVAKSAMSKARRNAIMQVIPRVFIDQVVAACVRVAAGEDKAKTELWRDIVARFTAQRVTDRQVLQLVGRSGMVELTNDDFAALESDLAAIVDREQTIESLLRSREAEVANSRVVVES